MFLNAIVIETAEDLIRILIFEWIATMTVASILLILILNQPPTFRTINFACLLFHFGMMLVKLE